MFLQVFTYLILYLNNYELIVIEQEISQYDIEDCEHDQEPGTTENNDENDIDEETM